MHKLIVGIGSAFVLMAASAAAQVSGVQIYSLPNTGGTSQWVKLGTYNASQQGYDVDVKIVSSWGYNAAYEQSQVSYIHFKSSNDSSVDGNGFAGDSWWYQTGYSTGAPSQVVWVANSPGTAATAFTLYANFSVFTGADSYYVVDVPSGATWTNSSVLGQSNPGTGSSSVLIAQNQMYVGSTSSFAGNVGIGTTAPSSKLEVNGNLALTSGSGASMTYADGSVQSTAWNGTTLGGDYAEAIDVLGDRAGYEPGDVIVIDAVSPGRFEKSSKAYSKLVAGVYSTKPGLVGRRLTFERTNKAAEVPMAMVGIVPTKVTTENGPIEPGDLLVSASKPGYAMKGTDSSRLTGAVLGKSLAPLNSGDGVIEVMISIQ